MSTRIMKTEVEVEHFDDKEENEGPHITLEDEFEIFLSWNNGKVCLNNEI